MADVWENNRTPYEVLGLEQNIESTEAEIKKAYRKAALLNHPDKNPDADPSDFLIIQRAYEILSDEDARKAFDEVIKARLAREARLARHGAKRRRMREELEKKEKEVSAQKDEENRLQKNLEAELSRLRKKLSQQQQQKDQELKNFSFEKKIMEKKEKEKGEMCEELNRTLKVTWDSAKFEKISKINEINEKINEINDERMGEVSEERIREAFGNVGRIEAVVFNPKKLKKSEKSKKRKKGSALVIMSSIRDASSALKYYEEKGGGYFFSVRLMGNNEAEKSEKKSEVNLKSETGPVPVPKVNLSELENSIFLKMKKAAEKEKGKDAEGS